ncbi:MAG TPA: hemolysin family protein [Bacteroidia bacterium]|jgi:CBS domain containing-hemolysin-like protein|nr:hemolysin family protein [Bacteroidia bacterium]HQF29660.1 hemolysin family protein [Bacteroidia bacterium]
MIADILFTALLVFLNGFFVAAEFAIVKVRASQVDVKANQGNRFAKTSQHILAHMDGYLSACQLGITLASLGLGWIGEPVVAKAVGNIAAMFNANLAPENLHQISIVIAFILITVLHIVLGEQVPKTAAIRNPLAFTLIIAFPLRALYAIFAPFIWILNSLSNLMLRIFGLHAADHNEIHTEEEIRMLLTESEEGGAIKSSENELIQNVFEFDDRVVRQILIPRTKISAIDVESTKEEVVQKVIDEGYSRMPVYQESLDNIIGVVYTKDLIKILYEKNFKGINDLIRPAYFIPLNKRINDLLREFQTQHIQMAIVTNEFGGTAGIVTMEDIIEELVGEIQDEYDDEKPPVEKKSETEFIVNATASIGDVNDLLPITIEESPNYDTVSGLLNYIYGRIPAVNEKRVYGGYEFTILKRFKHSVDSVKMTIVNPEQVDGEQ